MANAKQKESKPCIVENDFCNICSPRERDVDPVHRTERKLLELHKKLKHSIAAKSDNQIDLKKVKDSYQRERLQLFFNYEV